MEELNYFPIIQVVGYKNSGKTTFIQKLITALINDNQQYGVLKHHGHGGLPVIQDEGTDTWRYRNSGASVTAVEGGGMFQFTSNLIDKMQPDKLISFFRLLPLNGLIIEGFKQANYPKIVLVRSKMDLAILDKINNIKVIIYWHLELKQASQSQSVQFVIDDEESYIPYIVDWLKGEVK
jgi:molybdopterin-guanine dinucleotide biosynthesis adapter protein